MYPRNAASPPRIAIGAVVQISDGAVQTSGCTVRVIEQGGTEGDGAGTTAYSTDGVVLYTPTQAETDQSAFVLIAKKTGCVPASVTVVTTASAVSGYAGLDWATINAPTTTVGLSGTTIAAVTGAVGSVTAAVAITSNVKKNQALSEFQFLMTDATTHEPSTGLTVTVTRSIDGGAFGAGTLSSVTEVSNGIYSVDFGAGDLNGNVVVLRATATGADDTFERIVTQP